MSMQTINTLAHYLYPGRSNNHKAKILHHTSILVFIFLLLFQHVMLRTLTFSGTGILGYAANISTQEVINITNQKRIEAGLPTLSYSSSLAQAAKAKGEHMLAYGYWAHTAPDGTEPWKFFSDVGYKYRYAGENLARDFSNPASAVEAWMASPSHRDNMLSGKYKEIGIAVVEGDLNGVDTTIIVQLFGTKLADTATDINIAQAQVVETDTGANFAPAASITPSPEPTQAVPQVVVQISPGSTQITQATAGSDKGRILVSPFGVTKNISLATIILLGSITAIDAFVIHRRRVARISGRAIAHVAFFGMIALIILIARAGQIL
jgi:hypothetical protein